MTTPWGTHLGSEEYEPPMALITEDGTFQNFLGRHDQRIDAIAKYLRLKRSPASSKHIGYYHGWIPEITVTSSTGETTVTKHYAMGRFSHELAYVMPDNTTVYLSDDGARTGFFMYVADSSGNLSAGILYAAKWIQESNKGAGAASIEWINLGHAKNEEIEQKLKDMSYTFDDMWKTAKTDKNGNCPAEFTSTNSGDTGHLCVRLIESEAKYASRLETRLYAAYLGATTEFNKEEGITYDPDRKRLYVVMSRLEKGMEDLKYEGKLDQRYDLGGNNDIRINYNVCGAVYGLDIVQIKRDNADNIIGSAHVVSNMYPVIEGQMVGDKGSRNSKNQCNIDTIAMPDNVSYLPKYGILLIGEDSRKNQIDSIWAYNINNNKPARIMTTRYGAEATSPFWHSDINGWGYITAVVQHPFGETDKDKARTSGDKESIVGYIGPFPALN